MKSIKENQSSKPDRKEPIDELWQGVANLVKVFGAASAGVLPLILPEALVPMQLAPVSAGASALSLVAFMIGGAFSTSVERRRRSVVIVAFLCAVGVLIVNLAYVEYLPDAGDDASSLYVVVGFTLTNDGNELLSRTGLTDASRREIVVQIGHDRIPLIWGWSYHIVRWVYAFLLCGLIFSTVLGLTALVLTSRRNQSDNNGS